MDSESSLQMMDSQSSLQLGSQLASPLDIGKEFITATTGGAKGVIGAAKVVLGAAGAMKEASTNAKRSLADGFELAKKIVEDHKEEALEFAKNAKTLDISVGWDRITMKYEAKEEEKLRAALKKERKEAKQLKLAVKAAAKNAKGDGGNGSFVKGCLAGSAGGFVGALLLLSVAGYLGSSKK